MTLEVKRPTIRVLLINALSFLGNITRVRRQFEFSLYPLEKLTSDIHVAHGWRSLDNSPTFKLVSKRSRYPSGWVHMTSSLKRKGDDLTARLIVDSGYNSADHITIRVPVTLKGKINHIFKLPKHVSGLLWSPMQSEGEIIQQPILIVEISWLERIARMASWVAYDLWKLRKNSPARRYGLSL